MAAPGYQVFLSHSSKDKAFVRELHRRLTRDGVACFFDSESIGCGDNRVRALERAIEECEYIVFVLSPDFCNSEWVEVERTSTIADDPGALKRKVRPLMLRPCRDLPTFPRFLHQIQAVDVSTNSLFEENYPRLCRELGGESPAEKSFEPGHPSLAITQSNPEMMRQDLEQLEEARDLLREELASAEKSFEPGHPSIAISQSNLAAVLRNLEQLEEARDLLRQALASDEKSFESGHPSIATRQSDLALVLHDLGEMEEARDLLRQALASNEKSFEPGYPSIATRQSNLAMVLLDLGQLEEARDLLCRAYAASRQRYGPDHPDTMTLENILENLPPL